MFSCLMFSRYSAQALIDLCSDALDIKKKKRWFLLAANIHGCCVQAKGLKIAQMLSSVHYLPLLGVFNRTPVHNLYNENTYCSAPTTGIFGT